MNQAYIALGSNLENPQAQLDSALKHLDSISDCNVIATSKYYLNKPVGPQNQPDFVNAVTLLETKLSPHNLLQTLNQIEKHHGRIRGAERNGPRKLDLDILLYNEINIEDEHLTIPHPRMFERGFVLVPLADISPDLIFSNGRSLQGYVTEISWDGNPIN